MTTFRQDAKEGLSLAGLITLAVIFLCVLGFGIWGATVLISNVSGAGNAIKTKNSGVNRIQQQEQFEQLAADYTGFVAKIVLAKQAVTNAAGDSVNLPLRRTELEGLQQQCIDAAQQFNANSRKYTARQWKSAGLPAQLDTSNCS